MIELYRLLKVHYIFYRQMDKDQEKITQEEIILKYEAFKK